MIQYIVSFSEFDMKKAQGLNIHLMDTQQEIEEKRRMKQKEREKNQYSMIFQKEIRQEIIKINNQSILQENKHLKIIEKVSPSIFSRSLSKMEHFLYIYNLKYQYLYTTRMIQGKSKIDKAFFEYQLVKCIGKGSYGSVWLAKRIGFPANNVFNTCFWLDNESQSGYCAIKIYAENFNKNEGVDFSTLRQINFMLNNSHPNVASSHEVFFKDNYIHMVMDLYIELSEIVHQEDLMSNQQIKKFLCLSTLKGLNYLHRNYIMHRDLKPANIFLDQRYNVKIGDFGMMKEYGTPNKKFTPYVCTLEYRAPQLFFHTNFYTEKADIWSLGCIFFYIYTGKNLFISHNKTSLGMIIQIFSIAGTPNQGNWPGYKRLPKFYEFQPFEKKNIHKAYGLPKQISEIIQMCINLDPKKRPSTHQLLSHPFFVETDLRNISIKGTNIFAEKLQNHINTTFSK